jgi:NAD(P)-dependent dehydrogenase (short-subunit alcohol dehydrogenase family)
MGSRTTAAPSSFLGLEGLHVLITGSTGGIGSEAVRELLGTEVTQGEKTSTDKHGDQAKAAMSQLSIYAL